MIAQRASCSSLKTIRGPTEPLQIIGWWHNWLPRFMACMLDNLKVLNTLSIRINMEDIYKPPTLPAVSGEINTKEKKELVASKKRIAEAMKNMFYYLDGPEFCMNERGAKYIISKLERKGLYSTTEENADGDWIVIVSYLGWTIHIEEEMWAEMGEETVFCPPC